MAVAAIFGDANLSFVPGIFFDLWDMGQKPAVLLRVISIFFRFPFVVNPPCGEKNMVSLPSSSSKSKEKP